jgi:dipeptide transport system substrate-binding protein
MTQSWTIACIAAACMQAGALGASAARADTLVVCSEASPDALNATLSDSNTSFDVSEQIADRLVEMKTGGSEVIPGLAESWTISDEGLRYTFKLRHGVKFQSSDRFHPARDLNADDVVFSFQRVLDPANGYHKVSSGAYPMWDDFIAPIVKSVSRLSDDTVEFDLKAPSASFISTLTVQSFSIWPAEYAAAMAKAGTPELFDQAPLGTGPFQLVQYQKDSLIRFRANKDFWGTSGEMADRAPKVDQLVFSINTDPAVRLAKLRTSECQVARYPNPADIPAMKTTPGIVVPEAPVAAESELAWRVDKKPFDDRRVRQALAEAIDLKSLLSAVFQGSGTPTASLVPSALWGHNASLQPRPYDPAHAKALLAEAGYPNGFSTTIWAIPVVRAYMPNGRRTAELIQADWAKIGVTANIVTYEWGEFLRRRRAGEADVTQMGGTWDYPDPSELLVWNTCAAIPAGNNVSHWCNKQFSDLVAKADIVTNQAERAKLYEQAQAVFNEDIPGVMLADVKGFAAVRDSVQGFKLHFLGGQPFGGVSLKP